MRPEEDILLTARVCRAMGVQPPPLSPEEKARAFGDANHDHKAAHKDYEDMLVDRLQNGLPLSKSTARDARRILRERKKDGRA